jgi:hypothetical protein
MSSSISTEQLTKLFDGLDDIMIDSIMVGGTIDFNLVKDYNKLRFASIHCCLNGPVGVGKVTNFPGIEGSFNLKSLYDGRLTNSMWRNLCKIVGDKLNRNYTDKVEMCQQYKLHGNIWPHNDISHPM